LKKKIYKNYELLFLLFLLFSIFFRLNLSVFPLFKPINGIINHNKRKASIFFENIDFFFSNYFIALEDKSENKRLINEKRILLLENALLSTYKAEIDALKKVLNLKKEFLSFSVIPIAHIKGENDDFIMCKNISNEILKEGFGVISKNGVIGIIYKVDDLNIKIIPFYNKKSSIPVWVGEQKQFAFAAGNGKKNGLTLKLKYVEKSSIKIGDKIVTNGYDSIFPRNLYIGEVTNIKSIKNKFFVDVDVKTTMELNAEYFYVVKR